MTHRPSSQSLAPLPVRQALTGYSDLALLVGLRRMSSFVVAAKQEHYLLPVDAEEDPKEHHAGIGMGELLLAPQVEAVEQLIHGVVEPKLEESSPERSSIPRLHHTRAQVLQIVAHRHAENRRLGFGQPLRQPSVHRTIAALVFVEFDAKRWRPA